MRTREAFEILAPHRQSAVVVCALGMASNEWWAVTESDEAFYVHGAMGFASSIGIGIALTLKETAVWVLDADGALSMNLGVLLTEASLAPPNLKHFIVANHCYQTIGGSRMVGSERTDYEQIARGAGITNAFTVDSPDALNDRLEGIISSGHQFVVLDVECEDIPVVPPPQPYEGAEMKYRFGRSIERRFGVQVFGPEGY